MLSKNGPFAGIEPDNWSIQFVPLWQNTEEQEAIVRKIVAETDAIYLDRGVLDAAEVAVSRFGGNRWSMNTEVDLEGEKAVLIQKKSLNWKERKRTKRLPSRYRP